MDRIGASAVTETTPFHTGRRALLGGLVLSLAAPSVLRAQPRQLVIGGAASHKPWMDATVIPFFERKYNARIVFEGTRSLVNLEKMVANRNRQQLSVVQMDDPVMILAVRENLLEKLTPAIVPNLAAVRPSAVHMEGMWANYINPWQGIAYNTRSLPNGVASWADLWDRRMRGRVILPSLQNTEGLANLFIAAAIEAGIAPDAAQRNVDPGFRRLMALKPNLLTIYTQMPQAFNLLEQGEAWAIASAFSNVTLPRKAEGAPIDLAAPREGIFVSPSGICLVKGGPNQELAAAYVNEMLGAELQGTLAAATFSLPTNASLPMPAGVPNVPVHAIDWQNVAENRDGWVRRWDRDMAM
jgi:putative spermidine/putrescine transport system substrate-binding protein